MPENGDRIPDIVDAPEKEEPSITLYRVLTGVYSHGVDDESLRESGIFLQSDSDKVVYRNAPSSSPDSSFVGDGGEVLEEVPSLAVFVNLETARLQIINKRFSDSFPAIAVINVPLILLTGPDAPMRLVNHMQSKPLNEFELRHIIKSQQAGQENKNRYDVRDVNDQEIPPSLQHYATFLRPESLSTAQTYTDQPLVHVDLGKK